MKLRTKAAALLAALLCICAAAPAASAAQPGETVTMEIPLTDVFGMDGNFTYSNRDMFQQITYQMDAPLKGNVVDDACFYFSDQRASGRLLVSLVLAPDVQDGESCTVQLSYETFGSDGTAAPWQTASIAVTAEVPQPTAAPTEAPTEPPATAPASPEAAVPETTVPETTVPETAAPEATESPAPEAREPDAALLKTILLFSLALNVLLIGILIDIAVKQSKKTRGFILPDLDDEDEE